jgi:hypothetical protein
MKPKTIKYTNSLGELQVIDPQTYSNAQDYFNKLDEFTHEYIRKFNIMYDLNCNLVNEIELTEDELEYIEKTKFFYENKHLHKIDMIPRPGETIHV